MMRTTLNLDDDVAGRLREFAKREGRSLSRVVNDVLRAGFGVLETPVARRPYAAQVFDTGRPLLDVTDVAAALEALEASERSA
jgi:plasmid stability protein